ncbi:MAG TPA: hypothetical protein VFN34_06445 [Ornithinibacter sp.]|nr:hypothetical protein [Ornithinibacter sp.]
MDPSPTYDRILTVDGQQFHVRQRPPRGPLVEYDYDWLSGPNAGYGFGLSGPFECGADEHAARIREFLAGIDPTTGYLAED